MPRGSYEAYFICTTPRSGSTLLCRMIAATGVAGHPETYFYRPEISELCHSLGLEDDPSQSDRERLKPVFERVLEEGRRGGDLFGLRLQGDRAGNFFEKLAVMEPDLPNDLERIHAIFGKSAFVYLTRFDKLGQAISYVRAQQSGLWHRNKDGSELERLSAPQELRYDAEAITLALETFSRAERAWAKWFGNNGIEPLVITYEKLDTQPSECVSDVFHHLGLDHALARGAKPDVAKLSDNINLEWAERFRVETRSP